MDRGQCSFLTITGDHSLQLMIRSSHHLTPASGGPPPHKAAGAQAFLPPPGAQTLLQPTPPPSCSPSRGPPAAAAAGWSRQHRHPRAVRCPPTAARGFLPLQEPPPLQFPASNASLPCALCHPGAFCSWRFLPCRLLHRYSPRRLLPPGCILPPRRLLKLSAICRCGSSVSSCSPLLPAAPAHAVMP